MSTKHYTSNYLEETGRFLKNLKEYSYKPFTDISSGTVVDLGCGTGLDVSGMAKAFGEQVQVIGIDHDDNMLNKGREAYQDQPNVKFVLAESDQIPLETASAEGLRAERLIQHLKTPETTFNEMRRVLKDGQPLVIVETDWPSLTFYNEHFGIEKKITGFLTEKKINNGFAARNLTSYVEQAGFKDIHLEIFPFIINTLKDANEYLWIEMMIEEAAKGQSITPEEKDAFIGALRDADTKGYFACSINVIIVTSIR